MKSFRGLMLAGAAMAAPASVAAPAAEVKPLADVRLRYEHVDQDGLARDADAVTARLRAGVEVRSGDWSLLAEGEGTFAFGDSYDSGLNGKTRFPIVADPENAELNRLQVQYRGLKGAVITAGRQRINLDDQRFVGSVGWRQNEQTFDALRAEYSVAKGLKADLTYASSARTIWGVDGRGARQQAVQGDNVFATLAYLTPAGTLTGLAFLVDQDEAAVSGFRMSSQTYGVRFAGSRAILKAAKLNYALSYARQSDWHRNPEDYAADYYLAEASLDLAALKLGAGYEVLGASRGRPLTSFQTPLATLHKFQGFADKFLVTPPNGIRDLYVSAGYGWEQVAGLDAITAGIIWHRFDSDRLDLHYGTEWDAVLSARKGRWTATIKLADYDADLFAADTRKLWLQLDWAY